MGCGRKTSDLLICVRQAHTVNGSRYAPRAVGLSVSGVRRLAARHKPRFWKIHRHSAPQTLNRGECITYVFGLAADFQIRLGGNLRG